MATAAKFVLPIPIFFAYLVPLDMDVVPNKLHQFLLPGILKVKKSIDHKYSQTCIKKSPLGQRKNGLSRQLTS